MLGAHLVWALRSKSQERGGLPEARKEHIPEPNGAQGKFDSGAHMRPIRVKGKGAGLSGRRSRPREARMGRWSVESCLLGVSHGF